MRALLVSILVFFSLSVSSPAYTSSAAVAVPSPIEANDPCPAPWPYDVFDVDVQYQIFTEEMTGVYEITNISYQQNYDGSLLPVLEVHLLPDVPVEMDQVLFRFHGEDFAPEEMAAKFESGQLQ